jgi:hypothetical protein
MLEKIEIHHIVGVIVILVFLSIIIMHNKNAEDDKFSIEHCCEKIVSPHALDQYYWGTCKILKSEGK